MPPDGPERLSRGLVPVKRWLLAIPRHAALGFLLGGAGDRGGGGLIGLLALFAGVSPAFTARCPTGIFDLAVGPNRRVFRVVASAVLMTDVHPPFRLDQGATDPVGEPMPAPSR